MGWYTLFENILGHSTLNNYVSMLIKKRGQYVLNECYFFSYYGNYANFLIYFICDHCVLFDINPNLVNPYIHLLYHFVFNDLLFVYQTDMFGKTPMNLLNDNVTFSKALQSHYYIINEILNKRLLQTQQSYIRRWLSRKRVHKMKLSRCLNIILYSPFQQIEYTYYKHFKGGDEYKKLRMKYYL